MNDLQTITVERRGGAGVITLNRPQVLNAINATLMDEVTAALDAMEHDDDVGAVVIAGAGRAFCSGYDLKADAATPRKGAEQWGPALERDFEFLIRFWDYPKPTIAAVHGYCLAGGCELALSCDVTIAAKSTFFGEPELRFGSVITNMVMPWIVGPKLAKELLLSGEDRIDAERAERIGLVNRVVPDGEHLEHALALAKRMAALDRDAVRLTKRAINRGYELMGMRAALRAGLDAAIEIESIETPSRRRFKEITREQGLGAAIAWRDARLKGGQS